MKNIGLHMHCTDKQIGEILTIGTHNNIYSYDVSLAKLGGCPNAFNKTEDLVGNMNTIKTIEYINKHNMGQIIGNPDLHKLRKIENKLLHLLNRN